MSSHIVIDEFSNFTFASNKAKELAVHFKECIDIARCAMGWAVLAPQHIKTAILGVQTEPEDSFGENERYYVSDDYPEETFQSISDEIGEELCDYVYSYARSEEEGWYYSDED
jgi:hypothetical protein